MGKEEARKHSERKKTEDYSEKDRHREHKKRRKHEEDDDESHRKHKHRKKGKDKERHRDRSGERKLKVADDDRKDDLWMEKDLTEDGERILATGIPTAESLKIASQADNNAAVPQPFSSKAESELKRDDWMLSPETGTQSSKPPELVDESLTEAYGEQDGSRKEGTGIDFFSSLGTERKKPTRPGRPDPDKPKISSKELNLGVTDNPPTTADEASLPAPTFTPGGPGSQWRMMRLRRVYETSDEEGRPVEEVGIERFGSLQAFEDAMEERRILDERAGKRTGKQNDRPTNLGRNVDKKFMFTDVASGSSSRSSSFRRPGSMQDSAPMTPLPERTSRPPVNKRLDSLRLPSQVGSPLAESRTPIPSVMMPPSIASGSKARALSPSSLNKLQAKVIRAKLLNSPDAEKLEREYEAEAKKAHGDGEGNVLKKVEVMPTVDARGRMYDIGLGGEKDDTSLPGNRKKKETPFETHNSKGEVVRINPDDDTITLGEMLRQERMGAGIADQKNLDAQYARAIMGDSKFENGLEYMDDNAEKLGRQKMRSDAMKRQFAINDYKRTQKAMASCSFCYGEDDSPPKAPVVAMGTRVYLSCTLTEELVRGHCLIVPIQHHLNMLEGDDDVWDETKNFMKCLMRMNAEENRGIIFFETVLSLRKQRHTCIECVPVPWEQFDLLPGYFKESILSSEAEWSQHRKLIDFSTRPGGFRRAMVPNLPYFMVQFDYKGEKGYGHVIEGAAEAQDEDEYGLAEGEKGGGEFPFYFAAEIVGNLLDIEPRKWRRPKRIDFRRNGERIAELKSKYAKFDWTGLL